MTFSLLHTAAQLIADTASTAGPDPLTLISQIGIGAVLAAFPTYQWRSTRTDFLAADEAHRKELVAKDATLTAALAAKDAVIAAKDAQIAEAAREMYRRERDLNDAALPRLVDSITTLRDTQRMGDAIARQTRPPNGQDAILAEISRRLQEAVDALTETKRREAP